MSSREPQPRYNHAAFGVGMKHFVWGGDVDYRSTKIHTMQIETFDVSSWTWKEPQPLQGSLPDRLWGMAVTTDGKNVYSFGGHNSSTRINTVYQITPSTLQCEELQPAGSSHRAPKGTTGSRIVYFKEKLVVYGGYTGQNYTDDLYVFDLRKSEPENLNYVWPETIVWHQVKGVNDISSVYYFTLRDGIIYTTSTNGQYHALL